MIYSITHSYAEAVQTYSKVLEIEPENTSAILNLSEAYVLNNQNEKSDKLIVGNNSHFDGEAGKQAIKLLSVLKAFNDANVPSLVAEIKKQIDKKNLDEKKNRFENWGLKESIAYIEQTNDSKQKTITKLFFDYALAKISGNELMQQLDAI